MIDVPLENAINCICNCIIAFCVNGLVSVVLR